HYSKVPYVEYPIVLIEKTIRDSKQKHFFLIDDMIPIPRLLKLASMLKPLGAKWGCQLRPTREFTSNVLRTLHESGLEFVIWGVESGVDRILKLMKKGTNTADVEKVLNDSHDAGIKNITYIMFGFPTETKEEFRATIEFLKRNDRAIDLISPSTFGLQAGTPAFENPSEFGITRITEHPRELLGPKIEYELSSGLTHEEAKEMRDKFKRSINNINKYPKAMNFFREHMFFA
ncbi:MAG TPA: radical SAM protein, partial [Candidatus Nanoarchaeia archaeon]|nr:radical SAM protein [Candidatus Nanoarchaeia archaeon]